MEHEIWLTALFNDHLAGLGNTFLQLVKMPAQDRPWANFVTIEILVVLLLMVLAAVVRSSLSVEKPGGGQHVVELLMEFLDAQAMDNIAHHHKKYLPYFGAIFLFILVCNLIGLIPGMESPTMFPPVPAGCALATFAYYNLQGLREHGVFKYALTFLGPMPAAAPLMLPIEIISHLARPLSLTIRLFANMFAGEQVTLVFLGMVPLAIPAVFMGLHFFVGFIQAYVFTLLAMIYVGGAVSHEH